MRPIHKFYTEEGSTLCYSCYAPVSAGWSDGIFCNKCKDYINKIKETKEDEKQISRDTPIL